MAGFATKNEVCPIHIDFHKSLKCPKLTCASAYRSGKLTIRVLGIYNGKKEILHAFCWTEVDGGKGPLEILSCLQRLIYEFNDFDGCKWLQIWSDNTNSEVKNNTFCFYLDDLERKKRFYRIDLKNLVPGHSFSINDRIFSTIERHINRHTETLHLPEDWFKVIQDASLNGKINVIQMTNEHFLDFDKYFKTFYVKRFKNVDNEKFFYRKISWINFGIGERKKDENISCYSHSGFVWIRNSFDASIDPIVVDFQKKKQKKHLNEHLLVPKCNTVCKVRNSRAITKDLVDLASKWMPENAQRFYEQLRSDYLEVFGGHEPADNSDDEVDKD